MANNETKIKLEMHTDLDTILDMLLMLREKTSIGLKKLKLILIEDEGEVCQKSTAQARH